MAVEEQRIEEIHSFRNLLTDEAKKIHDTKYQNTIIEVNEHVDGSSEYIRHYIICQYFVVVIDPKDKDEAIKKVAGVFNLLVEKDMISGMLANVMLLPLAKFEDQERLAILMYVFPSLNLCKTNDPDKLRETLNQFLKAEAFVEEGRLGTADWRKLPT